MRSLRLNNKLKATYYQKGYQAHLKDSRKIKKLSIKQQSEEIKLIEEEINKKLWEYFEQLLHQFHTINKENQSKNKKVHIPIKHVEKIIQHSFILPFEEFYETKIYDEILSNIIHKNL